MLTKSGVALTFYAMFVASKVGKTSLTVTVDVFEGTTGTPIVSGGSASELGDGLYYYTLASGSVDASGAYVAVFKTADSSVDQQHIPALWVTDTELKNLDAAVSTRLASASYSAAPAAADVADAVASVDPADYGIGTAGYAWAAAGSSTDFLSAVVPGSYASGTAGYVLGSINPANVTVVSPVASDGTAISLVRGDDYANADGRALTFTGSTWPTLTSGTVALKVYMAGTVTSYAGVITGAQACYVALTDVQTAAMAVGTFAYDLEATLSGGNVITLVQGVLTVLADVR